jgi:hypothetical protein
VNKAFTPRIVQRLEPRLRESEVDLVQALTIRCP